MERPCPRRTFREVADDAGQKTPATALLVRERVPHTLHPYGHDPRASSYGLEAAAALGVPPGRLFKTLVVSLDGRLAVGVVPVAGSLVALAPADLIRVAHATVARITAL